MKVTWKFWTWRRRIRELENCREILREEITREETKVSNALLQELKTAAVRETKLVERLKAIYQRMPAFLTEAQARNANLERIMVLAGTAVDSPIWKTFLSYVDEHARNEDFAALLPNLDDANRHYNAGRAASASDFASAIREHRINADLEARKIEQGKK